MIDLKITNGKVVLPSGVVKTSIAIHDGKIKAVGMDSFLPQAEQVIDAHENYVLPGFVDPHSHLGHSPKARSFEEWKDAVYRQISTETAGAAAGGITTFFTLIGQGKKIPFDIAEQKVNSNSYVDMAFHIGIGSPEHIDQIPEFVDAGITSFKFHMVEYPNFRVSASDDGIIYGGLEAIRDLGSPAISMFHCENLSLYYRLKEQLKSQGKTGLGGWAESRPNMSEEEAMRRVMFFAEKLQSPIYIVHMSIREGVNLVREGKARGLQMVAETCPHYLTLTTSEDDDLIRKINPPLREKEDINAIWEGIRWGVVECIGSDHVVTHKQVQRELGTWDPHNCGFAGTELILPILLSEGVNKRDIPFSRIVEVGSTNPARIFGLYPQKGSLLPGADADLVIVDLKKKVKVKHENLHTESDYSVYEGRTFKGWPVTTIARGKVIVEEGNIIGHPGDGQYLPRTLETKP